MTRIALYARISTKDDRQHLENQILAMRRYVDAGSNWVDKHGQRRIVETYTDQDSGAKDTRPGLQKLLHDAARGKFDIMVVFALSRLTRGGPAKAFAYIERLHDSGVELHSATEPMFSTSGRAGALFLAIAAHIAQEERIAMQERVRAGIDRARAQGKTLGRPRRAIDAKKLVHAIHASKSIREIATELKVSPSTALRMMRKMRGEK